VSEVLETPVPESDSEVLRNLVFASQNRVRPSLARTKSVWAKPSYQTDLSTIDKSLSLVKLLDKSLVDSSTTSGKLKSSSKITNLVDMQVFLNSKMQNFLVTYQDGPLLRNDLEIIYS